MANNDRGNERQPAAVGQRWWTTWLVGLIALGGVTPVSAQTYTVFPAVPPSASVPTAQPTRPGATLVTLKVQDSTVAYVVHALVHQASLRLVYNGNDPLFAQRINVQVDQMNVLAALAVALNGTGLAAQMAADGETVVIRTRSNSTAATGHVRLVGGTIIGYVKDSAGGQGLGGAQVVVDGTKLSAVTADSGTFTLKGVPVGDAILIVKLFGYKQVERTVTVIADSSTTVHIVMVAIPTVLSGVVTTAAGTQKREEVGSDITTINADSIMKVAPIMSVTDLLENRVPGLTVLHTSGTPGDPSRLRLRGASTIYGNNDPIVIVDGIRIYSSQSDSRNDNLAPTGGFNPGSAKFAAPSPIDQIDPNSIETIEVLKGPSASALYGSDAANGVIVITTKRGRAGPTHWSLDLEQGVNWLPGTWPTNYYAFGTDPTERSKASSSVGGGATSFCNWEDPNCQLDSLVAFQALNDPRYTLLSHGSDQKGSLTVSGGVPALTYVLSGSGSGQYGVLKLPLIQQQLYQEAYGPMPAWMQRPDNYQTWGVTGQLSAQPSPAVHVTLQSSLFAGTQQRSSLQSALVQIEGTFFDSTLLANASQPLINGYVLRATDYQLTSQNALTLYWLARSWLPITGTGGFQSTETTDNTYIPFGVCSNGLTASARPYNVCTSSGTQGALTGDTTGFYGLGRGSSRNQTLSVNTTMPITKLHMTLALGGQVYSQATSDFEVSTNTLTPGVVVPTSFNSSALVGVSSNNATQQSASTATYGWFVQPQLNIASKLFISPGFRLDGGSGGTTSQYSSGGLNTGAVGNVGGLSKLGLGGLTAFPKISLSYVAVDRQNGHPLLGVVTLLRPRLAFGYAGTQPGATEKLRIFNENASGFNLTVPGATGLNGDSLSSACNPEITLDGSTSVPAVCLNTLGNTQLIPETSRELEGGFDATLWRGRMSLTYTQYNKTRYNAILTIPVAPSVSGAGLGGSSYFKNIGTIRNTGTEATLNAFVLQSRAVSWAVGANITNNNSLVVNLEPGQPPICLGAGSPCQGSRIVPGYPLFGVWEQKITSFVDVNHDGVIEPGEVRLGDSSVYVGQPEPKYLFNLTSDLTLFSGLLSVHATLAYQNGLLQNNQAALASQSFILLPNTPGTPLSTQAAIVEAECATGQYNTNGLVSSDIPNGSIFSCPTNATTIGLLQVVNTFRFSDLSVNFQLPRTWSSRFGVPRMTVALQGSNLGLHSNYIGKDPNVNAFSTVSAGDETADTGQLPLPRTWWLKVNMGN